MTKIYDNFFSEEDFNQIKNLIDEELTSGRSQWRTPTDGEELVDLGLENSKLYRLEGPVKKFLIDSFINRGFLDPTTIEKTKECLLRYHECKYPYHSLWHRDSTNNWHEDDPNWIGFNFYLHDNWKIQYGGIFLYKDEHSDDQGKFAEPIPNRLIFNDSDNWHSVTMIVDPNATRKSLNLFIPFYLKK